MVVVRLGLPNPLLGTRCTAASISVVELPPRLSPSSRVSLWLR